MSHYFSEVQDVKSVKKIINYEIKNEKGSLSYKIFRDGQELLKYLKKNKGKTCEKMKPVFKLEEYREYPNTEVRRLSPDEIKKYMSER